MKNEEQGMQNDELSLGFMMGNVWILYFASMIV